ncbi:MAG: CHAT domain-containing tetratricopeptide repeat protein [Acidobacteriota bacterium]
MSPQSTGVFELHVEAHFGSGSYWLQVAVTDRPTRRDRALLAALASFDRAVEIAVSPSADSQLRACVLLEEALVLLPASAPPLLRGRFRHRLGLALKDLGELERSAKELEAARQSFMEHSNDWELGPLLNDLGGVYLGRSMASAAEEVLEEGLARSLAVDNPFAVAVAWNNLGVLYASRGELTPAFAAYNQALATWRRQGVTSSEGNILHNLGVYYLSLGRVDDGIASLRAALVLREELNQELAKARTLSALAWGLSLAGNTDEAFEAFGRALEIFQATGARRDQALTLEHRAFSLLRLGRPVEAVRDFRRSMPLSGEDELTRAFLQLGLGVATLALGQPREALEDLQGALDTFDDLGVSHMQVVAHAELGRSFRALGDRQRARREMEAAVAGIEAARQSLFLPSFRQTYFGSHQEIHIELADLLAETALGGGDAGVALESFDTTEEAKARSLLESLEISSREQRVESVPPELARREGVLKARIDTLHRQHLQALQQGAPTQVLARRAKRLWREIEATEEAIRRSTGSLPTVVRPASGRAIQRELGSDTKLLSYLLGEERSWLWLVDATEVRIFELPPRSEIDQLTEKAHRLLPLSYRRGYRTASRQALIELSDAVLGPVARELRQGRVVVVGDGSLHYIPFAVLPVASGDADESRVPLLQRVEVVRLPSASVLVQLRRRSWRAPAPKLMAILADAVFEEDDPRLQFSGQPAGAGPKGLELAVARSARRGPFGRLQGSSLEASQILDLLADDRDVLLADGFEATRGLVLGGDLAKYRILHFATHGLVDGRQPELSGLVFSLRDRRGAPINGLLRPHEIQDLTLPADLVVLSACRTALGREIRGEGLVGLTQGFLTAGASRLVVSLWEVDDDATAELMHYFYEGILRDRLAPAAALRRAQLQLADREGRGSPFYWGAFALVGDWRPLPEPAPDSGL